jgi:peroxiredoxin Q/BCP
MKLHIGEAAPHFTLKNQAGEEVSLSDLIKTNTLILFFYPKDNSPGCTREACYFRDTYAVFRQYGAEVAGISSDSEQSHRHFSGKYRLPFPLLSDPGGRVRKLYGVPKTLGVIDGRTSFLIDRLGIIRHIFHSQFHFKKHVVEAYEALKAIHVSTAM